MNHPQYIKFHFRFVCRPPTRHCISVSFCLSINYPDPIFDSSEVNLRIKIHFQSKVCLNLTYSPQRIPLCKLLHRFGRIRYRIHEVFLFTIPHQLFYLWFQKGFLGLQTNHKKINQHNESHQDLFELLVHADDL